MTEASHGLYRGVGCPREASTCVEPVSKIEADRSVGLSYREQWQPVRISCEPAGGVITAGTVLRYEGWSWRLVKSKSPLDPHDVGLLLTQSWDWYFEVVQAKFGFLTR